MAAHFLDRLLAAIQAPLPQHWLSRVVLAFTRWRLRPFKNFMIRWICRAYDVDLTEAVVSDVRSFASFNDFFTRALKPEARPLAGDDGTVVSPVDGAVSQASVIAGGRIFQAKGHDFGLVELLGGDEERAQPFQGGSFANLYLSPRDYHRIHLPLAGRLVETVRIPGRLWAVNPATARAVPRLFARNERVAAIFETAHGPLALVMVGAIFVSAIETVWGGLETPPHRSAVSVVEHRGQNLVFDRGAEVARFNMGSTVLVLLPPGVAEWAPEIVPGAAVRMGQRLGETARGRSTSDGTSTAPVSSTRESGDA
ncbi:MAG: archaetidylserine decarboxylase [Acidobacteriota bacterium]